MNTTPLHAQEQAAAASWKAEDYARCIRHASIRQITAQRAAMGPGWTAAERQEVARRAAVRALNKQLLVCGLGDGALPEDDRPLDGAR